MAEPGIASFGMKISYKIGSGAATEIPRVTSIRKPGREVDTIDATHHQSPGKEFLVAPIEDFGEVTLQFNYLPEDESWIDDIIKAKAEYVITLPDDSTITFDGFATGYDPAESTVDGKEEATITIKVTGKPTFAAAP